MELATWRDISIVYLGIQCMIGLIIPLAAFYFIWRGARWLHEKLEFLMGQAQRYSKLARDKTEQYSARAAEPVIRGHKLAAQAGATWEHLTPGGESKAAPTGSTGRAVPKVYTSHPPRTHEGA